MHSPLTLASPVLAGNHAGDNVVAPLLSDEEKRVADWMNEQLAFEIQRIRLQHADARPLAVKNTSLVVKSGKIVNRSALPGSLVRFDWWQGGIQNGHEVR